MANNIWSSGGSTDGNLGSNWSLGHTPTIGEVAYYDATSSVDCTFTASISCDGINATSGYGGNIDFGDSLTHAYGTSGMVFSHAGNVDLGTGTQHTITNGDFDASGITGDVTTFVTSTVIFDGTCAFELPWLRGRLYDVEVTAGSYLTSGVVTDCGWEGLSLGNGATLDCAGPNPTQYTYHNTRALTLGDNSRITGTASFELVASGNTLTRGSNVIIDPASFYYRYSHTPMPGEYDCPVEFRSYQTTKTITFPAGTMTVTGNCTMTCAVASSYTMDFAANNGTLVVQGDLVLNIDNASGSLVFDGGSNAIQVYGDVVDQTQGYTFTADGQPLTLTSTNNQDVDLCGGTWGLITINKAGDVGTVTFSGSGGAAGINAIASSHIDFGDGFTYAWGSSGMVFDHGGDIDFGATSSHTNAGDLDAKDIGGVIIYGSAPNISTITLTGTSNKLHVKSANYLENVTIAAGAFYETQGRILWTGGSVLDIYGTLQIGPPGPGLYYTIGIWLWSQSQLKLRSTGAITTSGVDPTRSQIALYQNYSGGGLTLFESGGTITIDGGIAANIRYANTIVAPGDYSGANYFLFTLGDPSMSYIFSSGDYTFPELWIQNILAVGKDLTLDLATNNPNITVTNDLTVDIDDGGDIILDAGSNALTVQGDIVNEITGGGTFNPDTIGLTLTGNNDQNIDLMDLTWGLITINKAGNIGSVYFTNDGTADGLDVDAAALVDFADNLTMTWGASGFVIDHGGNCNMGTNTTHYMSGDYDTYNISGGHAPETSHVIFTGTSLVTFYSSGRTHFYDMTVQNGANAQIRGGYGVCVGTNDTNIDGTLNVSGSYYQVQRNGSLYVSSTGDIYGDGTTNSILEIRWPSAGNGIPTMDGTIRDLVLLWPWGEANAVFAAATYDCTVKCRAGGGLNSTLTLNGSYTFDALELECNNTGTTCLVDRATYDAPLTINGNLILDIDQSGGIVQISSASTPIILQGDLVDEVIAGGLANLNYNNITLTGTNDQYWDQPSAVIVGTLTINKNAGTVTPVSTMTCQEFIGQDGTFDPNAQTINVITTGGGSGDCDWQANFEFVGDEDAFNSCSWSIAGNFTADGQSLKATGGYIDDVPAAIGSGTSRFFGDDDYVDAGKGQQLSAFTLAGWCKSVPYEGLVRTIVSRTESANPWERNYVLAIGPFNELQLLSRASGTSYSVISQPAGFYGNGSAFDTWHHIAVTWSGGTEQFYLDGSPVASFTGSVPVVGSPTSPDLQVGSFSGLNTFDGLLDDVRVYSDVLTADEITYLYTNGISGDDPGDVNLVGYWDFDGDLVDKAVYKSDVPASIGSGTSRLFDGIDDYVDMDMQMPVGSMSFIGWLYSSSAKNAYEYVGGVQDGGNAGGRFVRFIPGVNQLQFEAIPDAGIGNVKDINVTAGDGTWHHVAAIIDVSNNTMHLYLNNVDNSLDVTGETWNTQLSLSHTYLKFGRRPDVSANYADIIIDDWRVYDDALTAAEVEYLFTNGISGDNPGTANLVGHWKFDGNLLDETDNNHGTAYGTIDGTSVGLDAPDWTLTVQGTAVASGVGEVAYSDASGGTMIDASAGPWVNNGNNDWWYFGDIQTAIVQSFGSFSQYAVFVTDFPVDIYIASALLNTIHLNDVGVVFRQTMYESDAILDLSSATELEMRFKKPDGTTLIKTATLSDDGTDGRLQYASIAGDLNQLGEWKVQPRVAFGSDQWYGTVDKFRVYKNL